MVKSRLDLPFHATLTDDSVFNTMKYLWNHMKCGVYVKIRNGELAMFVPFCNLNYKNTWADEFRRTALPPAGHQADPPHDPLGLQAYYDEKQAVSQKRAEEILQDVSQWWANGNILCNQHVSNNEERRPHFWGDQHLPQMKDMIQRTAQRAVQRGKPLADCDFFLNKRDHPLLWQTCRNYIRFPLRLITAAGTRASQEHAPILSFYNSPIFADVPFPCGED